MNAFLKKYSFTLIVVSVLSVFLLLSFKNPFSERSLVPNLEPYPDTLYYAAPAWSFVHGNGFNIKIDNVHIKSATPPLYSIYLVPFFALFQDVRSFYFANMLLMFGSIVLFMLALRNIYKSQTITTDILIAIVGFLFATNFYLFTIPTLLMAETISLFLVTLGLYLFTLKPFFWRDFIMSQIGALLLLVKFSNAPLTVVFYGIFLWKIRRESKKTSSFMRFIKLSAIASLYVGFYFFTSNILAGHKNLQSNSGFSSVYFAKHLPWHINTLLGNNTNYLWFSEKLMSPLIAIMSFIGLMIGLRERQYRSLTLFGLLTVIATVLLMSFFIVSDSRYVVMLLPFLFVFLAHVLMYVDQKLGSRMSLGLSLLIVLCILFIKPFSYKTNADEPMAITYKKQIGLNFKHSETPWNYKAVKEFNIFTETLKKDGNDIYIGTFLPPIYIQLYSNGLYKTLPIDPYQEFYWLTPELRKEVFHDNLINAYKELVSKGVHVYVSSYYLSNNSQSWKPHFDSLGREFKLEKVHNGCLGSCDIYELNLKNQ